MLKNEKIELLAENILLRGVTNDELLKLIRDYGLEFRKNKTVYDLKKALNSAHDYKLSHGKIELEIKWFVYYLSRDVFKESKV